MCSPKGVASIEWLAKVGTETNRSRTAEIMWGMVKEPAKVKLFRKTVPSLVPLMSSEEQQVVEVVTATVWFMAYDDAVCMSLGSSGAIPPLVKHASSKLDKIRLQATGILRNMAQHQTLLRMMEEKGCPSYLINAWKPIDVKADLTPTNVKPKFPAISLNMI